MNSERTVEEVDADISKVKLKITAIEVKKENQSAPGSLWKLTVSARKKTDKLHREIANLIAEKRAINGNPVPCDGYSGRQTNRR